eukprot:scaffold31804_cov69-Phaeocystis_antarctica.AAC.2
MRGTSSVTDPASAWELEPEPLASASRPRSAEATERVVVEASASCAALGAPCSVVGLEAAALR